MNQFQSHTQNQDFEPGQMHGHMHTAAQASVEERAKFIERTYIHLAGAIALFVLLEAIVLSIPGVDTFTFELLSTSSYSWLMVLGLFMGVSYIADRWARTSASKGMQYAGLGLYVVAEVVIFVPLLLIAQVVAAETGDDIILTAGISTMAIFSALTGYVLYTKRDFSWMRGALVIASLGVMGLIVASIMFGFGLGVIFTVGMIVLAACYVLYYTSNVLHHYHTTQHVAAALSLFSAVALLFWYVLRLVIALSGRD
ncbi:MAG: Bax inhibitor-1/YccA family protein [Nannocystaceae bacterium]